MKAGAWMAGVGVATAGLLLLGMEEPPRPVPVQTARQKLRWSDLALRVITYVARRESAGRFWAQNRNTDGAGLSFGILQWTQKSGSLGGLLQQCAHQDPMAFTRIFGVAAPDLLRITNDNTPEARLAPVGGVLLWEPPWTARFDAAGRHPPFQQVQIDLGARGVWMQEARLIGQHFGIHTERAYTLAFNRTNHMGWNARKIAERLPPEAGLMGFAAACAARYRATDVNPPGSSWRWVQESSGGAWHRFAGSVDLYADVVRRSSEILSDPSLSDEPLTLVYP